jgi:hypothetical protein
LVPPPQQNDQPVTVTPEVDSIARPGVDPKLQNTFADALHVRYRAPADPVDGRRHASSGARFERIEPFGERAVTVGVHIIFDRRLSR